MLSVFACSPEIGSEPGVGWRWALELSRRHDVTVLTHHHFRAHIEPRLAAEPVPGLTVSYFKVPWLNGPMHVELNSRRHYWIWQACLRLHVKRLLRAQPHDLIHHLTWGTYRFPCFLGGLGVPLALGPVGGGEGAPARMYRSWPWRERLFYAARQVSIMLSRWDPFVLWTMSSARCVLAKTRQTRDALPWFARARAVLASEIGVAQVAPPRGRDGASVRPLRLLYAGRLLGGKGVPYVLAMMVELAARGVPAALDIAGSGRLAGWAAERVGALGLTAQVRLHGQVPRDTLESLYDASDLLVFPSWHDSSGNVVTEALARGLPVLCLDRGGPAEAVDAQCALIVPTEGLDEDEIARALADRVQSVAGNRERLARLGAAATRRAHELSWRAQVRRAYDAIEPRLGWPATAWDSE